MVRRLEFFAFTGPRRTIPDHQGKQELPPLLPISRKLQGGRCFGASDSRWPASAEAKSSGAGVATVQSDTTVWRLQHESLILTVSPKFHDALVGLQFNPMIRRCSIIISHPHVVVEAITRGRMRTLYLVTSNPVRRQ